jgi:hypothetical protein
MAKKASLFEKMKENAQNDWTISDVEKLCKIEGLELTAPAHGSHHKVTSKLLSGILTVPHKRPIKPFYIKKLVAMIEQHRHVLKEQKGE